MEFKTSINIVAVHPYSFTDKDSGLLVQGNLVYYTERADGSYLHGIKLCKASFSYDYDFSIVKSLPFTCKMIWQMNGRYNKAVGISLD